MSYLIFCSFEVGGQPFKMADALNRHGVRTYYFSSAGPVTGHDSTSFHFGDPTHDWDLTPSAGSGPASSRKLAAVLKRIRETHGIDGCLATGGQAHVLGRAGIPYTYWSYGSDLDQYCFARNRNPLRHYSLWRRLKRLIRFYLQVRPRARASIGGAESLLIAPYQSDAIAQVTSNRSFAFLPHVLHVESYEVLKAQKDANRRQVCSEIDADSFFFSATRHVWTEHFRDWADLKGNDVPIRAFSQFVTKRAGGCGTKLVLVRKGPDFAASDALARELGIGNRVVWVDEMPREKLQAYYSGATICFGQFVTPAITYAALEPLAFGTPCVSWFDRGDLDVPLYEILPPLRNTRSPEEIAEIMCQAVEGGDNYAAECAAGWSWVRDNCSEENVAVCFAELFESAR